MDFWVVAAAAGAGYLAKYWKNIATDRDGSSDLYPSHSPSHDNVESSSLIHRIHGKYSNEKLAGGEIGYGNMMEGISGEKSRNDAGNVDDLNLPSSSVYPTEYRKYENIENESGYVFDNDNEMGASFGSRRSKDTFKGRHLRLQYVKPCSLLDNCFRENVEVEEFLRSPLISPCTTNLRPFLVTDGRRVISRVGGSFVDELPKKIHHNANDGVAGVPALPLIGEAANFSKEKADKDKSGIQQWKSRQTSVHSDSQEGSSSGQVLFCLGISIGIMCSIISNELEVKKLKDSLKQSENLVQDLQEELEMKDSLTVKELVYDDDSQDTHENLCCDKQMNMFSHQTNANVVVKCADEETVLLKGVETRSKIEAELEAELERLELTMIGSTFQGNLSDHIEFDQKAIDDDTIPELVHGELKADVIQRRSCSEPTPDQGTSTTSTPFSAKYGVSPRELSLRLHELIQSRLQDRIIELEEELTKTRKRVRDLESERMISWTEKSNSESTSTLGSPVIHSPVTRPLVMTLSDAALDAYNEAYYELNKPKKGLFDRQNGTEKMTFESTLSDDRGDDENDNGDDLLLIKQIVEKARQGSPAVLRAQRAMVYLDD